jgi:phenylacetate-coenzyme A ligase PaaK-like adenylate-forming protein
VLAGVYGVKVLVTVLFSRTLPLIRYEMSDSLQVGGDHDCACGRPYALITGIQGREQEALAFPTASGQVRVVQPIVFHHVMDEVHAAGWQIQQTGAGLDVLLAQPQKVDPSRLAGAIRAALAAQGIVPPPVHVSEVMAIPAYR